MPRLDELLRRSTAKQPRQWPPWLQWLLFILVSSGAAIWLFRRSYPRPDIWLGVDLTIIAVIGAFVSTSPPQGAARFMCAAIFIALGAVGVRLIIQQSDETLQAQQALNQRIADLNAQLTGDDSFAYIKFMPTDASNVADLIMIHQGNYGLRDINVQISDLDRLKRNDLSGFQEFQRETLSPHQVWIHSWPSPLGGNSDHHSFTIAFESGSGEQWTEELREQRVGDSWYAAVRVFWASPPKSKLPPMNFIDKQYPKNKISWSDWGD